MSTSLPIVGRETELAALTAFVDAAGPARAFVLTGAPGIGKTTVWEAGVAAARKSGARVLSARPAAGEEELSFAGLADLLEEVEDDVLAALPAPPQRALEVALLRAEPGDAPPGPRAIAAGLLGVLRELAGRGPLFVALDDVHWLDPASTQALAFAARRVGGEPVRFLLARREGHSSALEGAFAPADVSRLELGALSFGAVRSLLSQKLGTALTRRVLRQVFESSGGNPLFALEIRRMLAERGVPEVGEELPVPELVEDLVGARVVQLSPAVRRSLLAVALSPDVRQWQLEAVAGAEAVEEAVEGGVLLVEGDHVRPAHPLLAAAARGWATASVRRALHLELAVVVSDEELRARHLALGTDRPNAALAARVASASARAASRGAAGDSVDLAEHALRLTPPEAGERSERVLALAERLLVAGEPERASKLLASEFDALPEGAARARAHLLLAETDFVLVHVEESGAHLQQALAESSADPMLRAIAAARWSRYLTAGLVERVEEAERWAREALALARRAGPAVEREVLYALAFARKLRGLPIDDLCERFEAVSPDAFYLQRGIERIAAERLGTRGHVREARVAFRRLLALADERGEAWSSMWLLFQLCELELRAGEWETAAQLLEECEESPERMLLDTRGYERCRALLAAGRGHVEEAERWADRTIEACEPRGLRWNWLEALRARGLAALLAHEPARAAESLAAVWQHTEREGVEEPAEFPVALDLVEALVELGRLDEARAVADRLRQLAEEQQHPWGLASASRCEALVALASTHDEDALPRLTEAAAPYDELGLRFDHARTLRAAGRAARRLKKRAAARSLLEQAIEAFDALGSDGWAEDMREEVARIGGRAPAQGALTPTERRAAALAADGLSNKEIAAALFVTAQTVETHLKHVYAKLGVRSRAQLARRLAARS